MNNDFKEITSKVYIKNLNFDYLETYSLLRGSEFENKMKSMEKEFDVLEQKSQKSEVEIERYNQLNRKLNFTQYLFDQNGEQHFSSEKIKTLSKENNEVLELIKILSLDTKNFSDWMCSPIYRDAIVFYNSKNEIVSCMNICLHCEKIEVDNREIVAGKEIFEKLVKFFENQGHLTEK